MDNSQITHFLGAYQLQIQGQKVVIGSDFNLLQLAPSSVAAEALTLAFYYLDGQTDAEHPQYAIQWKGLAIKDTRFPYLNGWIAKTLLNLARANGYPTLVVDYKNPRPASPPAGMPGECLLGLGASGANPTQAPLLRSLGGAQLYWQATNLTGFGGIVQLTKVFPSVADLKSSPHSGLQFENVLLMNEDLSGVDLTGANLTNASVQHTSFARAKLASANLIGNQGLYEVDFTGCDLTGADFTGGYFTACKFNQANLTSANFTNATFISCDFTGAALSDCQIQQAFFSGCNFSGATLSACKGQSPNFNSSSFPGATISGCALQAARFTDANLSGANIVSCQLASADLSYADLSGATIGGQTNFSGAKVDYWKVAGAQFIETNLGNVAFDLASFEGAHLDSVGITGARFGGANSVKNFTNTVIKRMDFQYAQITPCDFTGANIEGTKLTPDGMSMLLDNAVLSNVDLSNTDASQTTFTGSTLQAVSFEGSNVTHAKFTSATLTRVSPIFEL